jgi:hypothetical protein
MVSLVPVERTGQDRRGEERRGQQGTGGRRGRLEPAAWVPPALGVLPALNGHLTETNEHGSLRNNFLLI